MPIQDNVCIYGASYGGYAVMAGITKTPRMYTDVLSIMLVLQTWVLLFSDTANVLWEHLGRTAES
ncbi:MAG: prolyl oligopeptidase family serine peptidase [Gammaproteobacteria bacterium]